MPQRPKSTSHAVWRPFEAWAALIFLASTACSKSGDESASSSSADSGTPALIQKAEVPEGAMVVKGIEIGRKGGTLVMSLAGDPKTFNEPLSDDVYSTKVAGYLFEALYDFDRVEQVDYPTIAEKWSYNEETREWTFHLRPNVKWSDGQPLTSDDFLFYTEVVTDESVPSTIGEYLEFDGEPYEFSIPDPLTFIAKIPGVDSFAFQNLGLVRALPRHRYGAALAEGRFAEILGVDTPPEDLVSSGPFRLKEFRSGEKVVLEANPYYYRFDEAGQRLPYIDELVLLNVPDFDVMALRFQAGDLDLIDDPVQAQNLVVLQDGQAEGDYKLYSPGLSLSTTFFWFNMQPGGSYETDDGKRKTWRPSTAGESPPADILARNYKSLVDPVKLAWFENDEFRRACALATNREAVVRSIVFGEAEPLHGFVSPANKSWVNPDIAKFDYDPDAAKKKLDAIGVIDRDGDGIREDAQGNPIRFTIATNKENKIREKIGVLLKEDMAKLGFDVRLQLLDMNGLLSRIMESFDYEVCLLGLSSGVPPHPSMSANIWLSSARMHFWNPNQPAPATEWEAEIDRLYQYLKTLFDVEEQKLVYDRMQAIWAEHQGFISIMTETLHIAASNKIGNLEPAVLRSHVTHNISELYLKP